MDNKITVSEVVDTSWQALKTQMGILAGLFVAYFVVNIALTVIPEVISALIPSELISVSIEWIFTMASIVISSLWSLGYIKNVFQTLDKEEPQLSAYNEQAPKLLKEIGASILYGIAVLIGTLLLIIPGLYIAVRFQFASMFIVEEDTGVIESLDKSWKLTEGHVGTLFLIILAEIGIVILGLLLLGVGFLIAVPLTYVMNCYLYRRLKAIPEVQSYREQNLI